MPLYTISYDVFGENEGQALERFLDDVKYNRLSTLKMTTGNGDTLVVTKPLSTPKVELSQEEEKPHSRPDFNPGEVRDPAARGAAEELYVMGVPLLSPSLKWGGHFAISTEYDNSSKWLSYWDYPAFWDFGVNPRLVEVLERHGLYSEWINAAVLGIYTL